MGGGRRAYLTSVGAMALQGPHQTAKASRTTMSCSLRAAWNSALLLWGRRWSARVPEARGQTGGGGESLLLNVVDTHDSSC